MAIIAKPTSSGTYEIFDNGKRIATGTKEYAQSLGATIDSSALPSLKQNTPSPYTAPTQQNQSQTLTGFNETVSSVVNLARQKRNKLALETVGSKFAPGTLRASDFGGILENLNRSSDTRVQDMLDTQAESAGQLSSETVGSFEVLRDATGKVVSTRSTGSEAQKDTDFEDAKQVLDVSKGSDGYVNTEVYLQALRAWPKGSDDFFKKFPPGLYINPSDPTVPDFIFYKTLKS